MYPRFEPRRVFFAGCRTAIGNHLLVQNAAQELRCSRD